MKSFALNLNLDSRVSENFWSMKLLQNISCKIQVVFGACLTKAKLRHLKILFVFRKMELISNFGISFCITGSYQHLQPFCDLYFKRKSLKNKTLWFLFHPENLFRSQDI